MEATRFRSLGVAMGQHRSERVRKGLLRFGALRPQQPSIQTAANGGLSLLALSRCISSAHDFGAERRKKVLSGVEPS